jgi:hypothetical protein
VRRFKSGGHPEREALVMRHARSHGYPVPEVLGIEADALVLEKIEGPTMWHVANGRPSTVEAQAALLAQLHRELHEIGAPDGLSAVAEGDRLLHLDPRRGEPMLDVAVTWVIAATSTGLERPDARSLGASSPTSRLARYGAGCARQPSTG